MSSPYMTVHRFTYVGVYVQRSTYTPAYIGVEMLCKAYSVGECWLANVVKALLSAFGIIPLPYQPFDLSLDDQTTMPTHQKYFHVFLGAQKNCYLFIILKKQGLRNKRYASNVCLFRIINTIKPKSISNRKKTHKKIHPPQNNKSAILRLLSTRPFSIAQSSQTQPNSAQPNTTQHNPTQHNTTQHNPTQTNSTQHNPTQTNSTQLNPTQLNSTQLNPTQTNSTNSTQLYPTQNNSVSEFYRNSASFFPALFVFPLEIHFQSVCL